MADGMIAGGIVVMIGRPAVSVYPGDTGSGNARIRLPEFGFTNPAGPIEPLRDRIAANRTHH